MATNKVKYKFPHERQELLKLFKRDQDIRLNGDFNNPETLLRMAKIDYANQKKLKKILKKIKTPTVRNIGSDGAEAVWMIAQHSANDLEFMKKVLSLIRKATEKNPENSYYKGIPYLIDRINYLSGKRQLYGTQFLAGLSGKVEPYPIKDVANIDERRNKYGLGPFKDYEKQIIEISKVKKRKVYAIIYL